MQTETVKFDVEAVRRDFPLIDALAQGERPLVYLDNAASTQKPRQVLDTLQRYYTVDNANIHRGVHALSQRATEAYDLAREKVQRFLNAREAAECIFTYGTTDGVNLVAASYVRPRLKKGANIVLTRMEHHANIVPWQLLQQDGPLELRVAEVDERGVLDEQGLLDLIDDNTLLVGLAHVSNALGTVNPARRIIAGAHARGTKVLLDAAQSAPHMPVDVQELGCDFLVFSGHKIYGPTGIGALYARREVLGTMRPWRGGGDMIKSVSFEKTTFKDAPERFEAGTPNIADAIGMGAAIDYLMALPLSAAEQYERELLDYATQAVADIPGLRIVGTAPEKASVLSFLLDGVHPHDIGTFLDADGIAIRAGHHCAQPLMRHFGIPGTARASFSFYNTHDEADALAAGLRKIVKFFGS